MSDVVYLLPVLLDAHPTKRPALVSLMVSTLAHALHDPHSRRWYCRLIWNAWTAEVEGRAGPGCKSSRLSWPALTLM